MGVRRFLISSANEEKLQAYHLGVCFLLNCIRRQENTVMYTCFDENAKEAIEIAVELNVTMQEIIGAGSNERWEILHQGEHEGWKGGNDGK